MHGDWCGSKVFKTSCRYCRKPIFIFTCDCECVVLFEDLGPPWPRHFCTQYLIARHGFTRERVEELVRQRAAQLDEAPPSLDHLFAETLVAKKEQIAPIVRVAPGREARRIVGVVREVPIKMEPMKRLKVAANTIQGRQVAKVLPRSVVQLTVHTGAVGSGQSESFTFWVTQSATAIGLAVGEVVAVELTPVTLMGLEAIWVAPETMTIEARLEN